MPQHIRYELGRQRIADLQRTAHSHRLARATKSSRPGATRQQVLNRLTALRARATPRWGAPGGTAARLPEGSSGS
jgi:hypothetical protein